MPDWILAKFIIGIMGTALTLARRYNNKDPEAGMGIAGWTIVGMIFTPWG